MFFLFPIPNPAAGLPRVTLVLSLLLAAVFLVTWPMERSRAARVDRDDWITAGRRLASVLSDPASGLSEDRRQVLNTFSLEIFPEASALALFESVQGDPLALNGPARYQWEQIYPHFEAMTRSVAAARDKPSLLRQFGFRPSREWFPGILTHQFLHATWFHLLGNLLFLWVAGLVVEPLVKGWLVPLYLAEGVFAAFLQQQAASAHLDLVLIGGSGSIAALMGFALGAAPGARVTLFYLVAPFVSARYGTFESPLWFCLPLWVLQQAFMATVAASLEHVPIGYMAHLGGFLFGLALGIAWRFMRNTPVPERGIR